MTAKTIVVSFVAAAILAQGRVAPARIGPTAIRLTPDDLEQINQLAKDRGTVWALLGHTPAGPVRPDGGISWVVTVFLEPPAPQSKIRRGQLFTVTAVIPLRDGFGERKTWAIGSRVGEWAQVPETKRQSSEKGSPIERPFVVRGLIDDDALLNVIEFIRTSPSVPSKPDTAPKWQKVQGTWPVLSVSLRDASTLEVTLVEPDDDELSGETIVLSRTGNRWIVKSLSLWAV